MVSERSPGGLHRISISLPTFSSAYSRPAMERCGFGTFKGLASWKNGKLTSYPERAGQYVFRLIEDHDATVWTGGIGVSNGRLCEIGNGNIRCYGHEGILGRGVVGLYEDSKGTLWAGVNNGL